MYYNISFDIAAILVLIVIAGGMKTVLYTNTPGNKLVCRYVYSVIGCSVIDIITAYTICYGAYVPDTLNVVLNSLYQYSSALCVAFAMRVILNYFPSASKVSVMINRVLLLMLAGFVTVNLFTGWMFRFEKGVYVHGSLYLIAYVLSLAIVFHMLFVVVKNRNDQKGVVLRLIVLFLFLPTIFTVIQMIVGNVLLITFGEAFSALIMLFAMETPDYRALRKTMKELDDAREEANVANKAKSDFLASMSHEIRTPLNGILGMNTMILKDSSDPQILEYAENIRIAGNGLLSIINDILDVTKIESGSMEIRPGRYDLFTVMNECYQMNRMRAADKGLEFIFKNDPDMPAGFYGDEVRIRQIMNNLVSNSVKYTREGSVKLEIEYLRSQNDDDIDGGTPGTLMISVTDTGIGIKKEELDRLFKRFNRLDEITNRNIEGTGLGLYITQRLVHMMNGSISVESVYGEGSVFFASIPQFVTDRTRAGDFAENLKEKVNIDRLETAAVDISGKKLLVVDDTKINLLVFKGLVRDTGAELTCALSGAEAIEMTKNTKFDMIFMDYLMPEMNGTEAFHRIQDDEENVNRDTPTIVLTANAVVGARESYLEEGFAEYLSKPVKQAELMAMIEKFLGNGA